MEERGGFEPPVTFATLDFESSAFDQLGHLSGSVNSPEILSYPDGFR